MTATVTPIRPDQPAEGEGLTGPQVCVLAGISYRQLDHWTRTGVLHAIGEDAGCRRGYTEAEARIAGLIKKLLDAGFMVRTVRTGPAAGRDRPAGRARRRPGPHRPLRGGPVSLTVTGLFAGAGGSSTGMA